METRHAEHNALRLLAVFLVLQALLDIGLFGFDLLGQVPWGTVLPTHMAESWIGIATGAAVFLTAVTADGWPRRLFATAAGLFVLSFASGYGNQLLILNFVESADIFEAFQYWQWLSNTGRAATSTLGWLVLALALWIRGRDDRRGLLGAMVAVTLVAALARWIGSLFVTGTGPRPPMLGPACSALMSTALAVGGIVVLLDAADDPSERRPDWWSGRLGAQLLFATIVAALGVSINLSFLEWNSLTGDSWNLWLSLGAAHLLEIAAAGTSLWMLSSLEVDEAADAFSAYAFWLAAGGFLVAIPLLLPETAFAGGDPRGGLAVVATTLGVGGLLLFLSWMGVLRGLQRIGHALDDPTLGYLALGAVATTATAVALPALAFVLTWNDLATTLSPSLVWLAKCAALPAVLFTVGATFRLATIPYSE